MIRFSIVAFLASAVSVLAQDVNPAGERFPQVALPQNMRGAAVAGALGQRLPEVAKWYGMNEGQLRAVIARDRSMIVDRTGRLAYACNGLVVPEGAPELQTADANPKDGVVYPPAQTFFLHSRAGANRKIYLDFDGHTTSGTIWNSSFNANAPFTTPAYDIDGNPGAFSSTELSRIQAIWKRVAEDFAPFAIDVTTEDPGVEALRRSPNSDTVYGVRVCIGGSSYDWYKRGAGGVAYVGSFNWNSDTPCFVFPAELGTGNEKYTAEATSHEVGHTLGLSHDGLTDGTEYYGGHGNWAPIMGVGYYNEVVQWSKGEYALANNTEDDTSVMLSYGAQLRPDEAGDNRANAAPLGGTSIAVNGVIQTRADIDFYSFSTGAGPVSFTVKSAWTSPNLDVALTLYDLAGNVIATDSPAPSLNAGLNATLAAGMYYIAIEGTAPGDPVTSYNDYGSLGEYELAGFVQSTAENFVSILATDPEAAETPQFTPKNLGTFTISRLVVSAQPLPVPFTVSGTAANGVDYNMPLTVTIPAGVATTTLTVTPTDDNLAEGSKSVMVTLSPTGSYSLAPERQATVMLRDNELPEVNLSAPVTQTQENSATPLVLTVRRSFKASTPLTVSLATSGTAEAGVDYLTLPPTVTIPAGEDKVDLNVQPIDNAEFNLTKTLSVAISPDVEYNAGFTNSATIRILNDELPPDPTKPSVTIASPKPKERLNVPLTSVIASGSAADNLGVARVQYRLNGGAWKVATLNTGAWSAELASQVQPGNNLLEVVAEDDDANTSPVAALAFTIVQPRNLNVVISGPGTVTPGTGILEARQVYTLKAKPNAGKIFAGWTGDLTGSNKALTFTMPDADTQVTATFVDNPFSAGVIGKYNGLLQGPTEAPETSGLVSLTVTGTGLATGKVWIAGKSYPVKGEFNGLGILKMEIKPPKLAGIAVALSLDMNPNGSQRITGTITGSGMPSTLVARRAPFDSKKNPLPAAFARSYTFFLPADSPALALDPQDSSLPDGFDSVPKPRGNGVGMLSISTSGAVKWTGTLGDGSPATQSALLDGDHGWPLYVPLYKGTGYIAGNVAHDPSAVANDLSALVNWVKPPNPLEKYFPGGFKMKHHGLLGVNYTAPARSARVLSAFDTAPQNAGPLSLQEGNLSEDGLSGMLTLLPTNVTQISSAAQNLKVSISAKTGAVSGSFVFPVTGKVTPIKGVILQGKIGKGIGFFPGSTLNNNSLQTGRLEFSPALTP